MIKLSHLEKLTWHKFEKKISECKLFFMIGPPRDNHLIEGLGC